RVIRDGNRVLARTDRGLPTRVVLAGHLDTVPVADNVPGHLTGAGEDLVLHGCGTVDMKSGDAVFLHLFATLADSPVLAHDLTLVLYDCEEIEATANGFAFLEHTHRDWLSGDVAILGEPTEGLIEAGCQGTLRVRVHARGVRAHSARSWLGDNAAHRLGPVLERLAAYEPRAVDLGGCGYREGRQGVRRAGGAAGNPAPLGPRLAGRRGGPPRRAGPGAVGGVRTAVGGHRRLRVPRGPPGGPHVRGRGGEHGPGRGLARRQLPLRTGPGHHRGAG